MITEPGVPDIATLRDFGFAAVAFFLVYLLLRQQQKKMFDQSASTLSFAKEIVSANTEALTRMYDALGQHMKQKDEWMERMKDCQRQRDERLKEIENRLEAMGSNGSRSGRR